VKRAISTKKSHSRFKFLGEVIAELKKVVWPTRQETMHLTILVLIVCIAVGLLLGVIDYGFSKLVSEIFLGG
jgi:preprotein translocase subunit SecE